MALSTPIALGVEERADSSLQIPSSLGASGGLFHVYLARNEIRDGPSWSGRWPGPWSTRRRCCRGAGVQGAGVPRPGLSPTPPPSPWAVWPPVEAPWSRGRRSLSSPLAPSTRRPHGRVSRLGSCWARDLRSVSCAARPGPPRVLDAAPLACSCPPALRGEASVRHPTPTHGRSAEYPRFGGGCCSVCHSVTSEVRAPPPSSASPAA